VAASRRRAGSWHEPPNQIRPTIPEGAAAAPAYVFDVNETLLDLAALDPHFERAFGDPGAREAWFQQLIQSALVTIATGRYHQFGTIAKAALDTTATRHGITLGEADKQAILQGMQELPPHPEVPAALGRLRDAGLRLAALTNSTGQVAQAQLANAGLAELFEQVLSADQAGRLKPAPEPYRMAADALGLPVGQLWLVAAHGWDVAGALAAGCRAAFVARPGRLPDPIAPAPEVTGGDLEQVADQLLTLQHRDAGAGGR
jgi:2-haloacid dehalogenase